MAEPQSIIAIVVEKLHNVKLPSSKRCRRYRRDNDASWCQFTQWLDYYGKIWEKCVVAIAPNYTSQDCSSCGHRTKKSLSTRTHSCPKCKVEICRDTNAAINILTKGMKLLGIEWQNSTSGQEGSAEKSGKHGEKTASTMDGQPDIASRLL